MKPFTVEELFDRGFSTTSPYCGECGAQVCAPQYQLHADWHNKVADL